MKLQKGQWTTIKSHSSVVRINPGGKIKHQIKYIEAFLFSKRFVSGGISVLADTNAAEHQMFVRSKR